MRDGELLQLGKQQWQVIETNGHHPGHLCFAGEAGLLAGDMVAGFGTILIPPATGDMDLYIEELRQLRELQPNLLFPSHGPVIALPQHKLNHYIDHRSARHQKVLQAVKDGYSNLSDIAVAAYADTPNAHPGLAKDQTLAHLLSHQRRNKVISDSSDNWYASID